MVQSSIGRADDFEPGESGFESQHIFRNIFRKRFFQSEKVFSDYCESYNPDMRYKTEQLHRFYSKRVRTKP